MIKIELHDGWTLKVGLDEIKEWCRTNLILADNWYFAWKETSGSSAVIVFKNEDDALAFKLRFEI